jgi:hypothetical protein
VRNRTGTAIEELNFLRRLTKISIDSFSPKINLRTFQKDLYDPAGPKKVSNINMTQVSFLERLMGS